MADDFEGVDDGIYDDYEPDYDDGLDECGNPVFECAGYFSGGEFYCPIAGTEECDWECPG